MRDVEVNTKTLHEKGVKKEVNMQNEQNRGKGHDRKIIT